MKYVRKMIFLLLFIVFFAALVICAGRILAIKNINVTMITYKNDGSTNYTEVKEILNAYKGESLLFLDEKQIAKKVNGSRFAVASCEKQFPCTLNVTIKERVETFAVSVGGRYSMYDTDGRLTSSNIENINSVDGAPNVELTGLTIEQLDGVAKVALAFKSEFGGLRSLVKTIKLDIRPNIDGGGDKYKLIFDLYCGLVIQIDDYLTDYGEKLAAVNKKFRTLGDRQKLGGILRGYMIGGENGLINADYSPQ